MGEEPAIFFRRDDKLGVGRDARGPGDSVLAGPGEKARSTGNLFSAHVGLIKVTRE